MAFGHFLVATAAAVALALVAAYYLGWPGYVGVAAVWFLLVAIFDSEAW